MRLSTSFLIVAGLAIACTIGCGPPVLNESYMPAKIGASIQYIGVLHKGPKPRHLPQGYVGKLQYTQKGEGVVEVLAIGGRKEGGKYVWMPPTNEPLINRRRIRAGFIETTISSGEESWKPAIKLGAKPGDVWEYRNAQGTVIERYVFERFNTHTLKRNNREYRTAVISVTTVSGETYADFMYAEFTYAEGLGLIKRQAFDGKGGALLSEQICAFDEDPDRESTRGEKLALE